MEYTTENEKPKRIIYLLRNNMLFTYVLKPFFTGRRITIAAIDAAIVSEEKEIAVFTQQVDLPNQ